MDLRYFPYSSTGHRPYTEADNLFDYHIHVDARTEELSVETGWRAELSVSFWLRSLRAELLARLEHERNVLQCRFCCTQVEVMTMKREPRKVEREDVEREATRLARILTFQAEHVNHLPASVITPDVSALAQQMIDTGDHQAMPILADALEEAGCDWALLLKHCRTCEDHGSRCWVLHLIERSRVIAQGD
jgi:hypothetical protein